jgi:hypothetical protein
VPGTFLGEVPREHVLTDRDPFDTALESQTDFVLLSEALPSFEVSAEAARRARARLAASPHWEKVSFPGAPPEEKMLSLFRRKKP